MDLEDLNLNKHKTIIEYYLKQENANIMPNKDPDQKYLKINFVERNDVVNIVINRSTFQFDTIISEKSLQNELYEGSIKNLVDNLFRGLNSSILTYGQTGSGKTFTMGSDTQTLQQLCSKTRSKSILNHSLTNGIIPNVLMDLFTLMHHEKAQKNTVSLKVSFIEIYMEKIIDLLRPKKKKNDDEEILKISDVNGKISIKELCQIEVASLAEVVRLLQQGSSKRSVGATSMNAQSSRSHAIVAFNLEIRNNANKQVIKGKLNLIDLAGSESQKKSKTAGVGFDEAKEINLGLTQLGIVIKELANKKKVVSYRDSKLTHFLKDSLGGNSQTLIIACISSDPTEKNESLNTIRYAQFARTIQNKVSVNIELEETNSNKCLPTEMDEMDGMEELVSKIAPKVGQNNFNVLNDKLNQLENKFKFQEFKINKLVTEKEELNIKLKEKSNQLIKIASTRIKVEDNSIIQIDSDEDEADDNNHLKAKVFSPGMDEKVSKKAKKVDQNNFNALSDKLNQLVDLVQFQESKLNKLVNEKEELNNTLNKNSNDLIKIARPQKLPDHYTHSSRELNRSECHICGKLTKNLVMHLYYHEQIRKHQGQLKCKYCFKAFSFPSHLKIHEQYHEQKRNFECQNCNKRFILKKDLKSHHKYCL